MQRREIARISYNLAGIGAGGYVVSYVYFNGGIKEIILGGVCYIGFTIAGILLITDFDVPLLAKRFVLYCTSISNGVVMFFKEFRLK